MNLPLYIAYKLLRSQKILSKNTKPAIKIGIVAISLSVIIMMLSIFILSGFKETIKNEVIGFNSHLKIEKYNLSNDKNMFLYKDSVLSQIKKIEGINKIFPYVKKTSILKYNNLTHPVLVNGFDKVYNSNFFSSHLIKGSLPDLGSEKENNQILISKIMSDKLKISVGDDLISYFFDKKTRLRKFKVCGIYETTMIEFDEYYCIIDIRTLQRLNNWTQNKVGGLEIYLKDNNSTLELTEKINEEISFDLLASNFYDNFPQIFSWLELQNINVRIIIILMVIIGLVNIVTIMFVILATKKTFYQITKSIGFSNQVLRKVFQYHTTFILTYGLLIGNIVALLVSIIQKKFKLIKLDPTVYFMEYVPIKINFIDVALLNLSAIVLSLFVLYLPTIYIGKVSKVKQ
ncbi:MAG: ABC transporter permease [Flavobacteriales bacterium TMED84]|nr:MAG: ABC transporter permease [Flavobacteriales bacterium TMED84]|tara:strand:+ start:967 stop:2172 length:1206 start_codon:yes stop_codon:yes gene_type:complete